jgi:DNA-directed RNA polymerase subunit RPC12/RpoP
MESSHWRCGSCGARFAHDDPAPRCPKCLKQSLVERAEPVAPEAPVYAETPTRETQETRETRETEQDRARGRVLLVATMPAVLAAMLASGWLGVHVDPTVSLLLAVGTAPIAGWLVAKDWAGRIFASIASMIAAVGIVLATTWYLRGRAHVVNVELLIPMALGGLPGLALFYGFRALAGVPAVRALLGLAAVVAAVVLVASC